MITGRPEKPDNKILPTFFVVGVGKGGTTSLYHYLDEHPDIYMPVHKEPAYFVKTKPFGFWLRTLDEYQKHFSGGAEMPHRGDCSTGYLYYHLEAAPAIHKLVPDAKIIVIIRNPLERVRSLYWFNVKEGVESLSLEDALASEKQRIENNWEGRYHYVEGSKTAEAITHYQNLFGKENCKVVFFDNLKEDARSLMDSIFDFLGVELIELKGHQEMHNKSGVPRSLFMVKLLKQKSFFKSALKLATPKKVRRKLKSKMETINLKNYDKNFDYTMEKSLTHEFSREIRKLEAITGRDLSHWIPLNNCQMPHDCAPAD